MDKQERAELDVLKAKFEQLDSKVESQGEQISTFTKHFFDWAREQSIFMNEQRLHNQKMESIVFNDDKAGTIGLHVRVTKNENDISELRKEFETNNKITLTQKTTAVAIISTISAILLSIKDFIVDFFNK